MKLRIRLPDFAARDAEIKRNAEALRKGPKLAIGTVTRRIILSAPGLK